MTETILAVDLGTSRLRAALFDRHGQCLAVAARDYPLKRPVPEAAEQNPLGWKQAFYATVAEVLKSWSGREVQGMSLSGQMHGTVLLGGDRQPLRHAIVWCDQRGADGAIWILDRVGVSEYGRITGNPLSTGFQAATLAWLRQAEPDRYEKIRHILLPKDYLLYELTGERVSEPTDAVSTGLFDLGLGSDGEMAWSDELLHLLDLEGDWFPDLAPSLEPGIRLTADVTRKTGLPTGLPVLAFGGDAIMGATVALGESEDGDAVALVSSGGQLLVTRDRPFPQPDRGIHLLPRLEPGRWLSMAAFLAAGLSLTWLAGCIADFTRREVEIGSLLREAAKAPAGSEGLCFLPHIAGERTPFLDPQARGAYWGIASTHTLGHFARAVLEGVAFSFRLGVEVLEKTGGPIRSITLGGGGAKSPLWRQIFADVLGREVRTVADVGETSLVGAAFAGARVLGWDPSPWIPKTVQVYRPDPSNAESLEANYRQFLDLAPVLRRIRDSSRM